MADTAEERVFARRGTGERANKNLPLITDKLTVPEVTNLVERPRIRRLLTKAVRQFPADLISGRAETGKTYAAVELSRTYKNVAWYTIEPADSDWAVFSSYFAAAVGGALPDDKGLANLLNDKVSSFLEKLFARAVKSLDGEEMLIVLDDVHHVFDAPWFADLFNLLLFSVQPNMHLLFLCRSKPPVPLWRLRSKQVLNVIDEKAFAFNETETAALCKKLGRRASLSKQAPESVKGRVGKIAEFIRSAA